MSVGSSTSRGHTQLLDCLRVTLGALSFSQWLLVDEETCRGGVAVRSRNFLLFVYSPLFRLKEACLLALRLSAGCSALSVELPLLWARFEPEEAVRAVSLLLAEVIELQFCLVLSHLQHS